MDVNTFFKLTYPDEGWLNKIFEIFEFNLNEDDNEIDIIAYEVAL
jgi:hypothetical protein